MLLADGWLPPDGSAPLPGDWFLPDGSAPQRVDGSAQPVDSVVPRVVGLADSVRGDCLPLAARSEQADFPDGLPEQAVLCGLRVVLLWLRR